MRSVPGEVGCKRTPQKGHKVLCLCVRKYSPEVTTNQVDRLSHHVAVSHHVFPATPVFNRWGHVKEAIVVWVVTTDRLNDMVFLPTLFIWCYNTLICQPQWAKMGLLQPPSSHSPARWLCETPVVTDSTCSALWQGLLSTYRLMKYFYRYSTIVIPVLMLLQAALLLIKGCILWPKKKKNEVIIWHLWYYYFHVSSCKSRWPHRTIYWLLEDLVLTSTWRKHLATLGCSPSKYGTCSKSAIIIQCHFF